MVTVTPKQKLYCYVDESGQDTQGRIFFVSIVILGDSRDVLRKILEEIEKKSGKHSKKWVHSTVKQRSAYIQGVFHSKQFSGHLYYSEYQEVRSYVDLTILSVAKAINAYVHGPYTATILVDALQRNEEHRFGNGLRKLRISTRKVRGIDEESDSFIRLADALAGFVREGQEGGKYFHKLYLGAKEKKVIQEV